MIYSRCGETSWKLRCLISCLDCVVLKLSRFICHPNCIWLNNLLTCGFVLLTFFACGVAIQVFSPNVDFISRWLPSICFATQHIHLKSSIQLNCKPSQLLLSNCCHIIRSSYFNKENPFHSPQIKIQFDEILQKFADILSNTDFVNISRTIDWLRSNEMNLHNNRDVRNESGKDFNQTSHLLWCDIIGKAEEIKKIVVY